MSLKRLFGCGRKSLALRERGFQQLALARVEKICLEALIYIGIWEVLVCWSAC